MFQTRWGLESWSQLELLGKALVLLAIFLQLTHISTMDSQRLALQSDQNEVESLLQEVWHQEVAMQFADVDIGRLEGHVVAVESSESIIRNLSSGDASTVALEEFIDDQLEQIRRTIERYRNDIDERVSRSSQQKNHIEVLRDNIVSITSTLERKKRNSQFLFTILFLAGSGLVLYSRFLDLRSSENN